jgi:tRNA (cytidine56-2'-O)-methyltransferase
MTAADSPGNAGAPDRPRIMILRLNHRPGRDARVTTHVALAARALGASGMYLHGDDQGVVEGIKGVSERFGGGFTVEECPGWRKAMLEWDGVSVHLTMYGERLDDAIARIPRDRPLLLVVGSAKVPREAYELAGFNVSVGNQPHSEVSAAALFLDRYLDRPELYPPRGGAVEIVPQARGKMVVEDGSLRYPTREACVGILRQVGCGPAVVEHCESVTTLAEEMVDAAVAVDPQCPVLDSLDRGLLVAGAMLHDVGRAVTHDTGHIPGGVSLARDLGLHPLIIRVIARHLGSGLEPEEAAALGFPPDVYTPESWEEKLVSLADSLHYGGRRVAMEVQQDKLRTDGLDLAADKLATLYGEVEGALGITIADFLVDGGEEK